MKILTLLNNSPSEEAYCCSQKVKNWKTSFTSAMLFLLLFFGQTLVAQAPTVSSFLPISAYQGLPVVITGTNFTGATAVTFGNTAAMSFVVNSATQITAIIGTGSTGSVKVTNPSGFGVKTGF